MQSLVKFLILLLLLLCLSCSSYVFVPLYKGNCVERAVKLKQYLEKKGYKVELIVGIIKDSKGKVITGHMWLRYKKGNRWIVVKNY